MKNTHQQKLIFIYNANSGLRNVIIDGAHKIFSPTTYECSLCAITYGAFTEDAIWKKFRKQSELEMEFLHKDEFKKEYASKFKHKFTYPIVLIEAASSFDVLIRTEEIDGLKNASQLATLISERVVTIKNEVNIFEK